MSEQPLAGQVAIVTGGSGAIGGAILAALAQAGAHAVALDVTPPAPGIPFLQCDVREDASVAAALAQVSAERGRLDIVVHAAGVARDAVIWKLAVDDWDFVHAVNLRGAFLVLRHAVPLLRTAGGGRVVLIGSINGSRGKAGTSAYAASKAGLLGLMRSVAREVGRFGVRVNVVEPGWTRTPLTERYPAALQEAARQESLLHTLLEPHDIAHAVLFLCGPGAARITGQVLRVDGGQYVGGA